MHEPRNTLLTLGLSAAVFFTAIAFLVPTGEGLSYALLVVSALCAAGTAGALSYAALTGKADRPYDTSITSPVDLYTFEGTTVPKDALKGSSPLVAFVRKDEVLHPQFREHLFPYFADSSLGFIQAATRYDGEGRVADAFRAQQQFAAVRDYSASLIQATLLRGSGSLLSRDALVAAYRDGISFAELGARIEAMGYATLYESTPLVLAWAPQTLESYRRTLIARVRHSATHLRLALIRHLPFEIRLQYIARPAVYVSLFSASAALFLAPIALVVRGSGPVILSLPAIPGLLIAAISLTLFARALKILSAAPLTTSLALGLAGTGLSAYRGASLLGKQVKVQVPHLLKAGAVGYDFVVTKVFRSNKVGNNLKRLGNVGTVVSREVA